MTPRIPPNSIPSASSVFARPPAGPTAHTAIIARSLDIPCVVGAGAAVLEVASERTCILDGSAGKLYIEPNAEDIESAKRFQVDLGNRRNEEYATRYEPAVFTDGHRVEVVGNIGKAAEAAAVEAGAEGIGLMRTEFLFLERDTPPSEDEQCEAYSEMTRALNGLPLILRTLDIGGDKIASYISLAKRKTLSWVSVNPSLLRQPGIFSAAAIAGHLSGIDHGPIKIMFPMISTLEDLLHEAKQVAEQVRQELGVAPVEIGIMVEFLPPSDGRRSLPNTSISFPWERTT